MSFGAAREVSKGADVPHVVLVAMLVSAGVLALSLGSKLRSREAFGEFVRGVDRLGVLPASMRSAAARLTVVVEAVLVVALALPGGAAPELLACAGLFAAFATALALAVRRGARESCHCFGAGGDVVALRHVLRSGALALLALAGAWAAVGLPGGTYPPVTGPGALAAFAGSALVVAVLARLDDLVWLLLPVPDATQGRRQRI